MISKDCIVSGNCIISKEEAISISHDVIKKYYSFFPNETILLTKYPGNYTGLKESIYSNTQVTISEKTIIKLFLSIQSNRDSLNFRYSILNTFYLYAHGMKRTDYLASEKCSFSQNCELFYNEFLQWEHSKYNYITSIQNFTKFYIIGIEQILSTEEYKFLLLSAVYYGHASFHYFIKKLLEDENTIFLLYEFSKINGGLPIKWRAGYLMSLFPEAKLRSFFSKIHDNDLKFQDAVVQHKVIEYLENMGISEPSCRLYTSQVLYQIENKDIFVQNHQYCL